LGLETCRSNRELKGPRREIGKRELPILAGQYFLMEGLIIIRESHFSTNGDGSSRVNYGPADVSRYLPICLQLARGCTVFQGVDCVRSSCRNICGLRRLRHRRRRKSAKQYGQAQPDQTSGPKHHSPQVSAQRHLPGVSFRDKHSKWVYTPGDEFSDGGSVKHL
jgi:hypothetical protein